MRRAKQRDRRPPPPSRRRITTETQPLATETEPEKGPLRRCIVTRERGPKERMIRFVIGPEQALVPDLAARLPGRGMWLSARADVLDTALARHAFARAARGTVRLPSDLPERLRSGLRGRIAETLGLARRAGQAVAGFEKARDWVRSGTAALVLQASDGSAEERRRLLSGARHLPAWTPLTGAELGVVFGREQTVHVAIARGNLASALANECERLAGLVLPAGHESAGSTRQTSTETADK